MQKAHGHLESSLNELSPSKVVSLDRRTVLEARMQNRDPSLLQSALFGDEDDVSIQFHARKSFAGKFIRGKLNWIRAQEA